MVNVGQVCTRDVYIFGAHEALAEAVAEMDRQHVGSIVVVEHRGGQLRPVGIVTDRDVIRAQLAHAGGLFNLKLDDVMTRELVMLEESTGISDAIRRLCENQVRRAPVVSGSGELVGIISVDDLLPVVAEELAGLARLVVSQARSEPHRSSLGRAPR